MLPFFQENAFPLYLAPMAGFTDVVFRQICKEYGADVMVTEFVMADKFLNERGRAVAWETVDFTAEQRPMGVQLFGSNPDNMGQAARLIVDRLQPDFIDINYGCPAPKVVGICAGSGLLRDLGALTAVAQGVVDAVGQDVPVTAKIRLGWDAQSHVALEAGKRLQGVGIQALAIHGRTKVQGYRGDADWDIITDVAAALEIPVIGNGAVNGLSVAQQAVRARDAGVISGMMIGRAALGYPWVFREVKAALAGDPSPPWPALSERWEIMIRYTRELLERPANGDRWDNLGWMRARLKAFTKLIPGSRPLRAALDKVKTYDDLLRLAEEHQADTARRKAAKADLVRA